MQLDPNDPLLQLSSVIPWYHFEETFSTHYTKDLGAPSKPIRLMVGLLLLNSKASVAATATSNLIVGVVSHEQNKHDSHTLPEILTHVKASRGKAVKQAVCDRGYRGKSEVNGSQTILPKKALKKDNRYQKDRNENCAGGGLQLNR